MNKMIIHPKKKKTRIMIAKAGNWSFAQFLLETLSGAGFTYVSKD